MPFRFDRPFSVNPYSFISCPNRPSRTRRAAALSPISSALAVLFAAGIWSAPAQAQVQGAWFAQGNSQQFQQHSQAARQHAARAAQQGPNAAQQQVASRAQLAQSLDNLNRTAHAIAAQQAAQNAARLAAQQQASDVADGLAQGGLEVASGDKALWQGASAPVASSKDGHHTVAIAQTEAKAILNWNRFDVGRNTTVEFDQKNTDAVLNRIVGEQTTPSQIQGAIKGDGTVMVVNQNGVVFSGTSQVNVRNLVVAAANITDTQFNTNGLYGANNAATFTNAKGKIEVQAGAQINTATPANSITGGGYVLLVGKEAHNAGIITTPKGQTLVAAGDSFIIKKGQGTEGNPASTTRGNEVSATGEGSVSNSGMITAATGDITLSAQRVEQAGVVLASTTVDNRGTVHLSATGKQARVTLADGATTAILLDERANALDSQREGMQTPIVPGPGDDNIVVADTYRRDLSLVKIDSAGTVDFQSGSITLATGGQVAVNAAERALVRDGSIIDVAGALGVKIAMESNTIKINVQGNEMRDAPVNRDSNPAGNNSHLSNSDVWVDVRRLVRVPAGTNGYSTDRWYTAGGLLELGGYLGTRPHSAGEWMAQGGIVSFTGKDVVTQVGSQINLSGGTLDVQDGYIRQSWLRGADGRLHELSRAPGDLLYAGLYKGFEATSARWGRTRTFYNPLIAPRRRFESGYTVGRDAGTLVIGTRHAVLEGQIVGDTFQGDRQTEAAQAGLDGYYQSQRAVARGGSLVVGKYTPYYIKDSRVLRFGLTATTDTLQEVIFNKTAERIAAGLDLDTVLPDERNGALILDTGLIEASGLAAVRIAAGKRVAVDSDLWVANGGEITLYSKTVEVNADLTSRGGTVHLGNVLYQISNNPPRYEDTTLGTAAGASVTLAEGVTVNVGGLWSNLLLDPANASDLPYRDGGSVSIRSSRDLTLGQGSVIDVSSGAALLVDGSIQGGRGGNITLAANAYTTSTEGVLTLDGDLLGFGVNGGGTLDLLAGVVMVGGAQQAVEADRTYLQGSLFQKGFSQYRVAGNQGLIVAEGAQIDVVMPVYRLRDSGREMPSGASIEGVLDLWTPPLYTEDPIAAVLTPRKGASLSLQAGSALSSIGDRANVALQIGKGATVRVDPGRSIELRSIGQLTVDGTLNAWGGRIELGSVDARVDSAGHGRSIWIGENAVLDVAARAATAVDALGNRYGKVDGGGTIVIGGIFDEQSAEAGRINTESKSRNADDVFVVIRDGALLDASGTSAVMNAPGRGAVTVASRGGAITLASSNGLYIDGTLRARSGGSGAAGGHLTVVLDTPYYDRKSAGNRVQQARELRVVADKQGAALPFDATPGQMMDQLQYGYGRVGGSDITAGGFDSLSLASDGVLSLNGDLLLSTSRSLNLFVNVLSWRFNNPEGVRVELRAPYVRLASFNSSPPVGDNWIHPAQTGSATSDLAGSLIIRAGALLELGGVQYVGAGGEGPSARPAFENVELVSGGDIRLRGGKFYAPGNLTLASMQLYPVSGAIAEVYAGWTGDRTDFDVERSLSIVRTTGTISSVPYSLFGNLTLGAATINHAGVVRAPLGKIILGSTTGFQTTDSVHLLDSSLTSVSADGLVMPYGGTNDGVTWSSGGSEVSLIGAGSYNDSRVELVGRSVEVKEGAVVDLSGGGKLTGAGFVSGRGGSTDARYHPLVQVGPKGFTLPGLATNPVYAIVPGAQALAAPAGGEGGASDPLVGQQITIQNNDLPGLAAGTYTLMPSTYALLPGAYRVEINGSPHLANAGGNGVTALRNGSYSTVGRLSVSGTGQVDSLPSQLILTSADTLRRYSQYNETSYADFVRSDANRKGVPRAVIEADAKSFWLNLKPRKDDADGRLGFRFVGAVNSDAAEGGRGSTLSLIGGSGSATIEILGDGGQPDPSYSIAVRASDLNKVGTSRMTIGGVPWVGYGQGGNLVRFSQSRGGPGAPSAVGITLRSGSSLRAPEVMLITGGTPWDLTLGTILIEQGASISTLGQGNPAYDSNDGFIYQPEELSIVSVSNGRQQWLAAQTSKTDAPGPILIGNCLSESCIGNTRLYSEGTIAFVTDNDFQLDNAVRYGTRHLSLAVGAFNVGSQQALSEAVARGALTPGLTLNQQVMGRLLQGDTDSGAPALETLELIAGRTLNFFETVTLSTLDAQGNSLLNNLMLTTPAIYGYGGVQDIARIQTGHLIWNGSDQQPAAVATDGAGTGSGTLAVEAQQISFGYGPWGQPDGVSKLDRLALGFASLDLRASERLTANNTGALAVYQSQGKYVTGEGYRYSGGHLNVVTPLWTGEAGSVNKIIAGGSIHVWAPESGPADPSNAAALGAELSLSAGQALRVDTVLALPSGKLTLAAEGDVTLGERAFVDLSGRAIEFFDDKGATQYSWGGDAILKSKRGNIRQAAGSTIDISAQYNQAGRLTAIALGQGAGTVDLQGRLLGGRSGHYEAAGTQVPYRAGGLLVQAQNLGGDLSASFAALNTRLNDGQVYGLRAFQIKQGDLAIGDELRANQIEISVDGGRLTVAGHVDASGEQVGSIRLAGKKGLTVAGNAVLDAHGTLLRLDSYGQIIEAPNRAVVELYSGDGQLTLAQGARIDLRHGTNDARVAADRSLHDGRALGTLALFAPRIDVHGKANTEGAATYGDVAIDASGALRIDGAKSIAINAVQRYDDAPMGTAPVAGGQPYQVIDQAYFDAKHSQSSQFIDKALANSALLKTKLAGLNNNGYRSAFHLRPGVEIVSATPDGDIVVSGDVDLSGYRYASLNPHTRLSAVYGSGEPGALAIRAGGDLSIYGSINDGFAPPPNTPDDSGWVLTPGMQSYGGDVVVPGPGVALANGTRFPPGKVLNYNLPIQAVALASGTELPVAAALAQDLRIPAGTVLRAAVRDAGGTVLYDAGTVLPEAVTLTTGTRLDAGFRLPEATSLAAMNWPAGVPLPSRAESNSNTDPDGVFLDGNLDLPVGALIPSMTDVKLVGDALSVPLRALNGNSMGRNWAVAAMLPEGSQSWGLRLVAGADLESADPRLTRPDAEGKLVLADTHYSLYEQRDQKIIPGIPDKPGGAYFWNEYGVYFGFNKGDRVPDLLLEYCPDYCDLFQYEWNEYGVYFGFKQGDPVPDSHLEYCPDYCNSLGEPIPGTPDKVIVGDVIKTIPVAQNFSVLRTGTGDLDLIAAGDVAMHSLYGVYTAGASTASRAGKQAEAFDRARSAQADGTYLSSGFTPDLPEGMDPPGPQYEALVDGGNQSTYAAWYPDGGGNLLVKAGGNLVGDMAARYSPVFPNEDLRPQRSSADMGNWLWRQGSGNAVGVQPIATSWWINFGTYVPGAAVSNSTYGLSTPEMNAVAAMPELIGFTGIGTLGGGNLSIQLAGDAGLINRRGRSAVLTGGRQRSEGLILAVGSTGRVLGNGDLLLTGGGDLTIDVGGGFNPGLSARADRISATGSDMAADYKSQNLDLNGVLTNLRGGLTLSSGEIGGIVLSYARPDLSDVRSYYPYTASVGTATGGVVLMLGDSAATLSTRGDSVVAGSGDPGRVALPYSLAYTPVGQSGAMVGGQAWFSLWTANTAINLTSVGGDLTPSVQLTEVDGTGGALRGKNHSATDGRFVWPSQLSVTAASGSVFLGESALGAMLSAGGFYNSAYSLLLAPSQNAHLQIMAGDSIYAGGYVVSLSAASMKVVPTPFNPAFGVFTSGGSLTSLHNLASDGIRPEQERLPLFVFGPNTATGNASTVDSPVRIYAKHGDVLGLGTGEILTFSAKSGRVGQTWYEGLGPVWMRAGRDIVRSGSLLGIERKLPTELAWTLLSFSPAAGVTGAGNLFIHSNIGDVSIIEAGRDILFSSFNVAGPGTLEVSASRNIMMAGQVEGNGYGEARLRSLGPIVPGDARPGADIAVQAGLGNTGANYAGFLDLYLDSQNLADAESPLADQAGKVVKLYDAELMEWLADRYGFTPSNHQAANAEARAYFAALPIEQQRIFARNIYFAELRAGGREFNDADGPRTGSYLRGRKAIADLFPAANASGDAIVYQGDLLMYGGAGIHTEVGGSIQILTPGGGQTYGIEGAVPPATAGLITRGQGDIQLYSRDSILLGQSRIMTTFGGDIFGWSAQGDINAGRGSKTTLVYTPPRRVYDEVGNVRISPDVPSTGAGIATLNPIPEVKPGDIDLIAPLGTIDAGEAGIRVSGNVNIAALHVVNAENIEVQGESKGIPVVAAVNVGALTSASSAASSAASAAQETIARARSEARSSQPSQIQVQVLGFGSELSQRAPAGQGDTIAGANGATYRPNSAVQVLGLGSQPASALDVLSPQERRRMEL